MKSISQLESEIEYLKNKIHLDSLYIKRIESENLRVMSVVNIERDELLRRQEKYDKFISFLESSIEHSDKELESVITFLSYPANKKGNIQYSKNSVGQHSHRLSAVLHNIVRINRSIQNIKSGFYHDE